MPRQTQVGLYESTAVESAGQSATRRCWHWISSTPTRAFFALLPLLFLMELLTAWTLEDWLSVNELEYALLDAFADLLAIAPMLYLLFVMPTARAFRRQTALEAELRASHERLEARVRQRTNALQEANALLRLEMEDRVMAQRSVQFQASLLDAVEEAVVATDAEGRILYCNRFAEALYGWTAGEVQGRPVAEVLVFRQVDGAIADYLGVCRETHGWVGWVEAVRRDGSRFASYAVCSELSQPAGGFVLVSLDITYLEKAEEALRESEERYISLVDASPTGIFLVQDGRLVFANRQLAEMLGYSITELLGMAVERLVDTADQDRIQSRGSEPSGSSAPGRCECRFVTSAGQVRWVMLRSTEMPLRDGAAVLCNIQDITEQKRMESDLRELSGRLLTVLEDERARVARDLHDGMGQTLSTIKLIVEATLARQWPEERRVDMRRLGGLVPVIQGAAEELRQITYALRPPTLDSLGLITTMVWYLRELQATCPELMIESELTAAESDVPLGLKVPIFRILQEATNNAMKHSRAARLSVGLASVGGHLRFWVRDDGIGVDLRSVASRDGQGLASPRCGSAPR